MEKSSDSERALCCSKDAEVRDSSEGKRSKCEVRGHESEPFEVPEGRSSEGQESERCLGRYSHTKGGHVFTTVKRGKVIEHFETVAPWNLASSSHGAESSSADRRERSNENSCPVG